MHRFFVDSSSVGDNIITITGDDAHHISNVLRLKADDDIVVCDNCGCEYYCSILSVSKTLVECRVLRLGRSSSEPPIEIVLYQGVPKGDKLETVIQKCVELGVTRIVPVAMKRSVAQIKDKEKKQTRMQRISLEASKQCGRSIVPAISQVMTFSEAIKDSLSCDLRILPYEAEEVNKLKNVLQSKKDAKKIAIFIGPEGGFDPLEVDAAKNAGFTTVTLGPRILRTETAPLACVSAVMYELGDW